MIVVAEVDVHVGLFEVVLGQKAWVANHCVASWSCGRVRGYSERRLQVVIQMQELPRYTKQGKLVTVELSQVMREMKALLWYSNARCGWEEEGRTSP